MIPLHIVYQMRATFETNFQHDAVTHLQKNVNDESIHQELEMEEEHLSVDSNKLPDPDDSSTDKTTTVFVPDNLDNVETKSKGRKIALPDIAIPELNCTQRCMPSHRVIPPMKKRPKLRPFMPNRKIFDHWGQNVSQLFIWTEKMKPDEEHDLMVEASKYIDQFWIDHQVGKPPDIPHVLDFKQKRPDQLIPEIYHYTWISCHNFTVAQYTSMISVLRNIQDPDLAKILVTTNCPPSGEWWIKINQVAKGRILVQRIRHFDQVWGNVRLGKIVHISDVIRIMLLTRYGGIFLDDDHVILKPIHEFFEMHIPTVGVESVASLQNCFQISPPNSPIYYRWLQEYKKYQNIMMGPFSVMKLWALWQKFPDEINAVQVTLVRSGGREKNTKKLKKKQKNCT